MLGLIGAVRSGRSPDGDDDDEPTGRHTPPSRLQRWRRSDFVRSLPFWGPPFVLMGFFVYAGIGWNFAVSLTDFEGFGDPDYSDLDVDNYVRIYEQIVGQEELYDIFVNTLMLMVIFTVLCLVVGLLLAILLDREVRFGRGFRTIYLLPMSLSFIVTAQFWKWMYNSEFGIVNEGLGVVGLGPYDWLGNPDLVLYSVIFALVWQFSGYTMIVYLAALKAIPDDQYEAARVDGASTIKLYWRVIIPQLKPAMVSASVVLLLFALKAFDFLYAMFDGYRPRRGADILSTKMMREAFVHQRWGYSSAIAIFLFVMSLAVIAPYLYQQHRQGNL